MPILYVNSSKRRGVRVKGRAKVRLKARRARRKKNPTRKLRSGGITRKTRMARKLSRHRKAPRKKVRRARKVNKKRSTMARRRKRRARKSTHRRRRRKKSGAHKTVRRRRRRARRSRAPKRRRRRARRARKTRRRRRRARRTVRRRRRRARRAPRRRRRRRARRAARTVKVMYGPSHAGKTLVGYQHNPRRRRRRRRGASRRRSRRISRRYGRKHYRRNPGGMLIDLAKQALPVLAGFYGARLLVSKVGPMIPGVSALGTLAGPALAVGTVIGVNYATKKIGALAKHRSSLMLGAGLSALDALISAFAPASIKSLIGMSDVYDRALGDYVAVGDYVQLGATPLNDRITMSDYVAVGGDGVEQELGLDQELGVEEELGSLDPNAKLGGVMQGSMLAPLPTKQLLGAIPARSFTTSIQPAGTGYDASDDVMAGIFAGGFGK